MLIRFVISNFLSFDEETEFNMLAGSFKQHKEHVYKVGKLKVLKAAAIYGANAAGKSNLIKAIDTLQNIVEEGGIPSDLENKKFKLNPNNKEKPIQFEIEFSIKNKIYAYGLIINKNQIIEEWLYESGIEKEDKLIFERKSDKKRKLKISLGKKNISQKEKLLIELLEDNLVQENELVISKYEILKIKEITIVYEYIIEHFKIVYPNDKQIHFLNFLIKRFPNYLENLIKSFDLGIENFDIQKEDAITFFKNIYDLDYLEKIFKNESSALIIHNEIPYHLVKNDEKIYVEKSIINHLANNIKIGFDLGEESMGTQRIIDFLPFIVMLKMSEDIVILIDEIDQSIHVNLLYELVEKIMSLTDTKGQLIFTTHESNLLDLKIFRQDEIWFAEKDRQKGSTQLYSLSEFNPRYDLDIRKGYLQGRFGAIPFLADLEKLDWSNLEIKQENQEEDKEEDKEKNKAQKND
ncbi:ATP-binding protein [Bernardetia sp. Wsw4-3y2]|uniref:AAA family ATPase n=1 Tax=Bernardetia sp. Wsw4-3y2 TaxID=3127471 RepID=UPI0030CD17FF